jgi:hypothetical protein
MDMTFWLPQTEAALVLPPRVYRQPGSEQEASPVSARWE